MVWHLQIPVSRGDHIIPWNLHGAVFAGRLGIAALQWAPYTFFAYLTPIVTFLMVRAYYLRKNQLSSDQDADQVYGAEPKDVPAWRTWHD